MFASWTTHVMVILVGIVGHALMLSRGIAAPVNLDSASMAPLALTLMNVKVIRNDAVTENASTCRENSPVIVTKVFC